MNIHVEPRTEAEIIAGYKSVRSRLFPAKPPVNFRPEPKPTPPPQPEGPLWSDLSANEKCALVREHWHEGMSVRDVAAAISSTFPVPVTKNSIGNLIRRYSDKLAGIKFHVPNGPSYVFKGRKMSLAAISREVGIGRSCLEARLVKGWTMEEAVSVPAGGARLNQKDTKSG